MAKVNSTVREVVTRQLARLEDDKRKALAAAAQHHAIAESLQDQIDDLQWFIEEADREP